MKTFVWTELSEQGRKAALARPPQKADAMPNDIARILARVKAGGDAAVRAYSRRFDTTAAHKLRVPAADIAAAVRATPAPLRAALRRARANIATFHKAGLPRPVVVDTMPGVRCTLQWRPLEDGWTLCSRRHRAFVLNLAHAGGSGAPGALPANHRLHAPGPRRKNKRRGARCGAPMWPGRDLCGGRGSGHWGHGVRHRDYPEGR